MQLRYNYRAYPDAAQRRALAQAFGCARVVWNDCLRDRKEAHAAGLPYVKSAQLSRLRITQAKRTEERAWLADVSAVVLQQSLRDLDTAYKNFFDSLRGKRQGRKVGPPRYKSKKDTRQSIRLNTNAFCLQENGTVYVAKVGNLKVKWSRRLPAAPTSLTVTQDSCGRYFLSFVVDTEPDILPGLETESGIDLGLSAFAVLSDGRKIDSPRFLRRAEKKLKRLQQDLSRKAKGSKNRAKARIKVARQHAKVADRRRDFHHKASTQIIRDSQAVYVEDLAVSGLGRTRLAKSVHDAGWSAFVCMLEYKAVRHGRTFAKVDRAFPSSQVCSACGFRDGPKPLHVREWTCGACGTVHDRDHNAARNVLFEGRRIVAAGRAETPNASQSAGKTRTKVPARRVEAGSPPEGSDDPGRNPWTLGQGARQCERMEIRELRYFVAIAEELHFGKAARRLEIAQPPLSRTIARLERQLGVTLLERTSRKVTLTEAGAVLLSEGRAILSAVAAAERRTQQAAQRRPRLVLAVKSGTAGELLAKLLDAYRMEPGAATVDLLLCEAHQHQKLLQDAQADVALLHLPFDSTVGLDTETLYTEGQVAILPSSHALSGRSQIRMAEVTALPELPMARWPGPGGSYPEGPGAEVRNLTQLFQLIALGRTTVIMPESAGTDLRRDLAAVPVVDAPPVTTVIAWPPQSRLRAVADLIRVATRL